MKILNFLILSCLAFIVSGCASFLLQAALPTPGHSEYLEIGSNITNHKLTERLLYIFAEKVIIPCGRNSSPIDLKVVDDSPQQCTISWSSGIITKIDREAAIIEVGRFPNYTNNVAGHSARVSRYSETSLEVAVKGTGVYYIDLPNEEVARQLTRTIKENL